MRKKIFILVLFLFLSFVVALATTFTKVEATKHSDLENISCGWPLKFVLHDDSLLDPPMPWKDSCGFLRGPYEQGRTKEFNWGYLILDTVFFYLFIAALYCVGDWIVNKYKRKNSKTSHEN